MFDWYGGFTFGEPTIISDLQAGDDVGFDVVANTRWGSEGFGMRSENLMTGKFNDAGQFQLYTLYEGDCGRWGFFDADVDRNCEVDLADFAVLAGGWLHCTDPDNAACDQSWRRSSNRRCTR